MKLFFIAALLLSSSMVFAMPAVNDFADFDATIVQSGQTYVGDFNIKLTAYDAATQQFTEQSTQTFLGQTQTSNQAVGANQLYTDAAVAQILANCVSYNGTLQTINTATASYATCALPVSDSTYTGTVWIGNVAFGIVQLTETKTNGDTQTLTIKSFTMGQ